MDVIRRGVLKSTGESVALAGALAGFLRRFLSKLAARVRI
jgi:hypothetical protein